MEFLQELMNLGVWNLNMEEIEIPIGLYRLN